MRRTVLASVGVVVLALLVGGCASKPVASGEGPGQAVTTPNTFAPVTTKNDCSDYVTQVEAGSPGALAGSAPKIGRLPASAHPVALLECVQDFQDVAGQGQSEVVNTVRSTGSVDAFVSALRAAYVRPPEATPQNGSYSCAAVGYTQQWLALIDADGTVYRVEIPFWGICSAPDRNVVSALQAVKTQVTSTERIRQTVSPGAQASGCEQQFADMAFVAAQMNESAASRPFFSGQNAGKSFHACYYKLTDTTDKQKPAGDFETATTITGTPATTIYDGLTNAPTATNAKNCTTPATEYAVLFTNTTAGDWSVVELTGCKLAAPDSGPAREVPAPVMQVLLAAKGG